MKYFQFKDNFNHKLKGYIWDDIEVWESRTIRGIVQIVHGINEHGMRYNDFAKFMNQNGYIVYAHDHLSQGKSRRDKDEDVVYFGRNGVETLLDGVNQVRRLIKETYPNTPVHIFAHSLGALLVRSYLIDYENEYDSIVLSGTGLSHSFMIRPILAYGQFLSLFRAKKPSKFFDGLFRKTQLELNKKVKIDHFIEWLTSDKEQNELDKQDPYLFKRLTTQAFVDVLELTADVNQPYDFRKITRKSNILLISGTHDPATKFGAQTIDLVKRWLQYDLNVKYKLYEEARHDLIHETNKLEVYKDILAFYKMGG